MNLFRSGRRKPQNNSVGCGTIFVVLALFWLLGKFSGSDRQTTFDQSPPTVPVSNTSIETSVDRRSSQPIVPRPEPEQITGKVVGIADGDTLTLLDDWNKQTKIRLHGIDCPEGGQPFGEKASQALAEKVFKKRIRAVVKDTDKYGRTVASIYIDDRFINKELIEEGWGWHYRKYSDSEELADAEVTARQKKSGLWADANAVPPWDWRQGIRVATESSTSQDTQRLGLIGGSSTAASGNLPEANRDNAANYAERLLSALADRNQPTATVYVTKTGSKYHSGGCRFLSKSRRAISLSSARTRYSACSVCGGGGYVPRTTASVNVSSGRYDEELGEWLFVGQVGSSSCQARVFLDRDGKWRTRLLKYGNSVVSADANTPGRGKGWDERLAKREREKNEREKQQRELKALSLVESGNESLDNGDSVVAVLRFQEVVKDYADTPAAEAAQELLDQIETKAEAPKELPAKVNFAKENEALRKLRLAERLLKSNASSGKKWLQQVIDDFPDTSAAAKAKERLAELE